MSAAAAIIGAVFSAIGTIGSLYYAKKQAKAAKRLSKIRERQMRLQAARERRRIVRQAVISRAQAAGAAYSAGIGGSSPVSGSLGSVASITAGNIQTVSANEQLGAQAFQAQRDMISAQSGAATVSAISSLGSGLFRNLAGISRVFGS